MSIATTDNKVTYNGNGATTEWPFNFPVLEAAHLKVILTNPENAEIVLTSDYVVDLTNKKATYPGYVAGQEPPVEDRPAVLPTGWKLTLLREVPYTQETDLGERWPFKEIEQAIDRTTMQVQQLAEEVGRSVKVGITSGVQPDELITEIRNSSAAAALSAAASANSATQSASSQTAAAVSATQAAESAANAEWKNGGTVTGNVTVTGAITGTLSGNASTATKLSTARKINGIDFDGTEDISIISTIRAIRNLKILVTSNTAAAITADMVAVLSATNQCKILSSVNLTLNTGSIGANGLDAGTLAVNSWYYPWIIYNPTTSTVACLLSASSTAPTLPSGYTYYARVGSLRTNSNGYLYRTIQKGCKAQYIVDGTILTGMRVMASGAVGTYSDTTPTWSAVSVGEFVPGTANIVNLVLHNRYYGGAISAVVLAPNTNYGGVGNTTGNPPPIFLASSTSMATPISLELESTNIYMASNYAGAAVYCMGWEDNL